MALLTNFSFEFSYKIFTEDASLPLLYHGAKKSKMTKNSNQGGGGPALTVSFCNYFTRRLSKDFFHSDSLTVHSPLLLSVFVARFWLPVVNLGSHSSLVYNPKQSEQLQVFSNGIFLLTLSLKTACLVGSFQIDRRYNRNTLGGRFWSS